MLTLLWSFSYPCLTLFFPLSLSTTVQPNNFADNESNIKPISAAIYESISLAD